MEQKKHYCPTNQPMTKMEKTIAPIITNLFKISDFGNLLRFAGEIVILEI
jgi:hypothetical protein